MFLAFALASYNLDRLQAWQIKLAREHEATKQRSKRRKGTWHNGAGRPTN